MSCLQNTVTHADDVDKCLKIVDVCDNVMECICCLFFLEKHKALIVEEVIEELRELPKEITKIKVPLYPLPENKYYYNFNGINTIIYNLFKSSDKKYIKSLGKEDAYLKVFYERNSLFTLPIIQIEILFFKRLHSKTIDEIWKKLKAELLYFTSSIGDIDVFEIDSYSQLEEQLNIPMIVGHPEFKKEGVLLQHRFSQEQIQEMNYLHSFTLTKLEMKNIINNSQVEVFEKQIDAIKTENRKKEMDSKVDDDIIRALFAKDEESNNSEPQSEFDEDELPF